MRAKEFISETTAGATGSGSVAVVTQPMGTVSRSGGNLLTGKYTKEPFANTPQWMRKGRRRAR